MRNYGFDYLLEKVQVLNEMAPKSKFWNTNFPEFMNFYLDVQKEMRKHPKAPSDPATRTAKRIEYISRMLFDFLSKDELAAIGIDKKLGFEANVRNLSIRDLSPEERIERGTRKMREYTAGYAEFAGTWADNTPKQQDYMISLMVRAYEDKALSKKFTNKVMNDANIDAYFNDNLLKRLSSNFAAGTIAKKEKMFGMDMEEAYIIQNKARSIIQKLRKSKKLPKGLVTSIYYANTENIGERGKALKQDDTAPLQAFIDSLEGVVSWKNDVRKIINTITLKTRKKQPITDDEEEAYENLTPFEKNVLADYNVNEIIKLMQLFTQRLENKQPVKNEKIYNIIDQLGHEKISEFVKNEFDNLLTDYGEIIFSADEDRYATIYDALDDVLLNGLIDEGIITDEEKQLLAKWRKISSSLQQSIVSKSSRDEEKVAKAQSREDVRMIRQGEYEKQGKKWEADKELKERGEKKPKIGIENEVSGLSASEIEEKLRVMMDDDDPDYEKIDAMSKYLNKLKKDSPEDEERVMGYMTEQVNKDRHLNNIGEYKDRGFKKPINYAHWLWMNG